MDYTKEVILKLNDQERKQLSDLLEFSRRYLNDNRKKIDLEFGTKDANEFDLFLSKMFDAL